MTLAPADPWWQGVANTYELAIEVSVAWRRLGIARQLLSLALEFDAVEEMTHWSAWENLLRSTSNSPSY